MRSDRRLVALICFVTFIVLGAANSMLGPTLASVAGAIALPLAAAGILRSFRQIGSLVGTLAGGALLDRRDMRWIMIPGALLMAIGSLGLATASSIPIALGASLAIGLGSGFFDIGPNFIIGALFVANASAMLAALHTFFGLGASAGPLVTEWATQNYSWQAAYAVVAAAAFALGVVFLVVRTPQVRRATGTQGGFKAVQWLPLLPLMVMIFMYSGAGNGLGDWLFIHMQNSALADPETATRVTSLFWLGLTAGRVVSIFALSLFGTIRVLGVALGLSLVGVILVLFGGQNIPLITVGVACIGLGFAPVYPVVIALGGQQQSAIRGMVIGILSATAAVGAMTIPLLQGWVSGGQSGGIGVTLAAILSMIGAFAVYRVQSQQVLQPA